MSGYRKEFTAEVTIDGQQHVITLRPMTFAEGMEVSDASGDLDPTVPEQRQELIDKRMRKARELVPAAILKIDPPVLDADGVEVATQELCAALYFASSMAGAIGEWVNRSRPANPS